MKNNITFLVIGHILLSIGILGHLTNNPYLAVICVTFALIFFIRQLVALHVKSSSKPTEAPTITS